MRFPALYSVTFPHSNIGPAMSFNAPFTTMSYYGWLFENDSTLHAPSQSSAGSSNINGLGGMNGHTYHYNNSMPMQNGFGLGVNPHILARPQALNNSDEPPYVNPNTQVVRQLPDTTLNHTHISSTLTPRETANGDMHSFQSSHPPALDEIPNSNGAVEGSYATSSTAENSELFSPKHTKHDLPNSHGGLHEASNSVTSLVSTPSDQRSVFTSTTHLPDAYSPKQVENLPAITPEAREGIIKIISEAHPVKPDGSKIDSYDALLSLSSLQHYSNLFFTRFNSSYPLIHQATFDSSQVHTFLLMSILLLGATYSDKEAHMLAVGVHDVMRPLIHASKEFSTKPKLWMLQVILLVECFGKSRAGEKQHDMR